MESSLTELSKYRFQRACEDLNDAKLLMDGQENRNRNYAHKKTAVQDFCFPYGSISFAENIAVRPGAGQRQRQNIIVNAVDQ